MRINHAQLRMIYTGGFEMRWKSKNLAVTLFVDHGQF